MYRLLGCLLCMALIFMGMPAYSEVSLNQEDDFALLANHPETSKLLALKGAGPAGSYEGNVGIPADTQTTVEQTPPAVATPSADDEFITFMLIMGVAVAVAGAAYFAVYGVA